MRRIVRAAVLATLVAGCGGETREPPSAPAEPAPEQTASPVTEGEAPPETPAEAPSGKRAPCTFGADQTCNADPRVSALWGRCTELGVCECREGFRLNPGGACEPAP